MCSGIRSGLEGRDKNSMIFGSKRRESLVYGVLNIRNGGKERFNEIPIRRSSEFCRSV